MTLFLCKLWPYLAGGLIGWLLAGWFARRLKHSEVVERVVEKEVETVVDNPKHLALIGKLEGENSKIAGLMSQVDSFKSAKPKVVEKEVEKIVEVDNPELLERIKKLQEENKKIVTLNGRVKQLEDAKAIADETVGKGADNAELLARIKTLEAENSQISGLQSKLKELQDDNAKSTGKKLDSAQLLSRIKTLEIENAQIASLQSKLKARENDAGKQVDNPEHLKRIEDLEQEISRLKQGPKIDLGAAKAVGIKLKDENDLTAIEGIGPKISDLIKDDGINTFALMADTNPAVLQKSLDKGGASFKMANPGTWPDQANLAANNRWPALKALQDVLIGGVYPDDSTASGGSANAEKSSNNKKQEVTLDIDAAKAAGFKIKQNNGQDNLTLIEGIGPKINELIHAADIHTFAELSRTKVEVIQKILDDAGSSYKLAKPGTWPAQADMAATNQWEKLKVWQDELDGGKES